MRRPVRRSHTRIFIGKVLFTLKRYIYWILYRNSFSRGRNSNNLPHNVISHKTPVLRKFHGLDMRLQENKRTNLMIAIGKLDGILIKPGEVFSYWRLVGRPDKRKGYLLGLVLFYGKLTEGIGGGLCQLTNLLYWMTLHTPMTVTERYRHSYDVFPDSNRTQPFGSGATCVYPYRDLQIKNNTSWTFQLRLRIEDDFLKGCWLADSPLEKRYEVYQKEHSITHEYWGGYVRHNTIYRKVLDKSGNLTGDEFLAENHAIMMYEPFLKE